MFNLFLSGRFTQVLMYNIFGNSGCMLTINGGTCHIGSTIRALWYSRQGSSAQDRCHLSQDFILCSTVWSGKHSGGIPYRKGSKNYLFACCRPPDKSVYWKTIFFISHPKHMLWVLKRTVSMRRFF